MTDTHPVDQSSTHHRGSLKRRVFLLFGGFTLGLSVCYSALCLLVAYIIEDNIMYRLLEDEAQYLRKQSQVEQRIPQPRTESMRLYIRHNGEFKFPKVIQEQLAARPNAEEIFTATDDTHYHLKPISFDDGQYGVLVANVTPYLVVTTISKNIMIHASILVGMVLSAAMLIAYRITVHAVAPVEKLSGEVHSQHLLTEHDLVQPPSTVTFTTSSLDNEIGYLSGSLEHAFNQLSAALSREKHFTRDLSHEMRTPLTIIKNGLTLIEQSPSNNQEALQQIRDASLAMDQTVEVLLALARESSLNQQPCELRQLIEEGVLQLYLSHPECEVVMDVDKHLPVESNPHLIALLIRNLLENAARYSSNRQLRIFIKGEAIAFYNGISQQVDDNIMTPGTKRYDSEGIGQGLYLVERIIDRLDWRYDITMAHDHYQFNLLPGFQISN